MCYTGWITRVLFAGRKQILGDHSRRLKRAFYVVIDLWAINRAFWPLGRKVGFDDQIPIRETLLEGINKCY